MKVDKGRLKILHFSLLKLFSSILKSVKTVSNYPWKFSLKPIHVFVNFYFLRFVWLALVQWMVKTLPRKSMKPSQEF